MNCAYLLTGSNLNDPETQVGTAFHLIEEHCGKIVAASALYGSAPWGIRDQPEFINQAICLETNFSAKKLLKKILAIEKEMGRERLFKMGPRLIDIDILLFNDDSTNRLIFIINPLWCRFLCCINLRFKSSNICSKPR